MHRFNSIQSQHHSTWSSSGRARVGLLGLVGSIAVCGVLLASDGPSGVDTLPLWTLESSESNSPALCADFAALHNEAPPFRVKGTHQEHWKYQGNDDGHVLLRAVIKVAVVDTHAVLPLPSPTPGAALMSANFECNLLTASAKVDLSTDATDGKLHASRALEVLISMPAKRLSFAVNQDCTLQVALDGEGVLGLAGLLEFEAYFGDVQSLRAMGDAMVTPIPGLPFQEVGFVNQAKVSPHPGLPLEVGTYDPEIVDVVPLEESPPNDPFDPKYVDIGPLEDLRPDVVPSGIRPLGGAQQKISIRVCDVSGVVHLQL